MTSTERRRRLDARRKAAGICVRCGKESAMEGRTECFECHRQTVKKCRLTTQRGMLYGRREVGRCPRCGSRQDLGAVCVLCRWFAEAGRNLRYGETMPKGLGARMDFALRIMGTAPWMNKSDWDETREWARKHGDHIPLRELKRHHADDMPRWYR